VLLKKETTGILGIIEASGRITHWNLSMAHFHQCRSIKTKRKKSDVQCWHCYQEVAVLPQTGDVRELLD